MRVKQLFMIGIVGILMAVAVIVAVSAQGGAERPYAEGQGGETGRMALQFPESERPYQEGEGASAQGVQIGEEVALRKEGETGTAGKINYEGEVALRAETFAPPGFSVLYRFTGVTDDGEQGSDDRKEATAVICTNLAAENNEVFVEVYQWNGTTVYTGTMDLGTGETATYSTQGTTVYFENVIFGGIPGTLAINQGYGIISAVNSQVICTAQALDPFNNPPTFVNELPLFRD